MELGGCCGIMHQYGLHRDMAGTEQSLRDWNHAGYISLADIPDSYSGLNVISFNKNQLEAYDIIKATYPILYESDWVKNRSPMADIGDTSGVKLVIFQTGKMEVCI